MGSHGLQLYDEHHPVAAFFSELGKLLLMFSAGLEIDLAHFRKVRNKAYIFGILTTTLPLLVGTAVGLLFGYGMVPALVIGSLLESHTLLGLQIVSRLGAAQLEPIIITVGATVVSDTLSLVVFAICVPTYQPGFSMTSSGLQLLEIAIFVLSSRHWGWAEVPVSNKYHLNLPLDAAQGNGSHTWAMGVGEAFYFRVALKWI